MISINQSIDKVLFYFRCSEQCVCHGDVTDYADCAIKLPKAVRLQKKKKTPSYNPLTQCSLVSDTGRKEIHNMLPW